MSENLKIEDFFKNNFEEHTVEPRSKVWSGISKQLWKRQFTAFFKMSFEGYQVKPSSAVWGSIARKLWFYNFLRFNPASFNVYYLGFAVSVLTSIIISSNNTTDTYKPVSIISNSIENSGEKNYQSLNTNESGNSEQKTVAETNQKKKFDFVTENNTNKNIVAAVPHNNLKNIVNNKVTPPAKSEESVNTVIENTNSDVLINGNTNNIPINNTEDKNHVLADAGSSFVTETKPESKLSMIQSKNSLLPVSDRSDVLFPDTFGFNFFGAPIILERTHWAVDAWWSPIYNSSLFESKLPEFQEYVGLLKNSATDDITLSSFGGDLNYSYKNYIFQLGISYTELGQKMKVPNTITDIFYNSYYNYFENNIIIQDTIWFIDLDSLLQNPTDTVWIPKPVETLYVQKDSILINDNDTVKTTTKHVISNRYSYFEVPIMAGYEIKRDKFSVTFKGGIAAGFFIRSAGSIPASNNSESVSLSNSGMPYIKPNFSVLFSVGLNYHLNKKIALFGEPYVRKNINSVFENRFIYSQKFYSFGVKFGVKYTFK